MLFKDLKKNEMLVLKAILSNARATDSEICEKTGLSRSTVAKIRADLENRNVIDAYVTFPTISKTLIILTAFRWTNFGDMDARKIFEDYLKERKDIAVIMKGTGFKGATHTLISFHKSTEEYESMMSEIRLALKSDGDILDMFVSSGDMQIKHFKEFLSQTE